MPNTPTHYCLEQGKIWLAAIALWPFAHGEILGQMLDAGPVLIAVSHPAKAAGHVFLRWFPLSAAGQDRFETVAVITTHV